MLQTSPRPERPIGRERELRILEDLLAGVGDRGSALLLRGEPGVGKSFLLRAAKAMARERGVVVLSSAGVLPEAQFPFAGLHRLVRPILDAAEALPPVQREALDAAFGLRDATVPDLFLVAMAALTLLSTAAVKTPLLVVVDDVQWLDPPTRGALSFIARRIESEPILLLAAARTDSETQDLDVGELEVEGLSEDAATALLRAHAPTLGSAAHRRVIELAAGNPLALVELPAGLVGDARRADGAGLDTPLLTARLERAFAARTHDLSADTRMLLLIAAVDEVGNVAEVLRASSEGTAAAPLDVLDAAVDSGLITLQGDELHFRHPLVRSAIHDAASIAERQRAHAALAAVLTDRDRQTWHRAAAILGEDDLVASELADGAERAHRRGAATVAVTWLDRAVRLTADPSARAGRLLRAAELGVELGRQDLVAGYLEEVGGLDLTQLQQGRLEYLREVTGFGTSTDERRVDVLLAHVENALSSRDVGVALQLLLAAALHCWWHEPTAGDRERVVAAAQHPAVEPFDPLATAAIALASPIEHHALVLERIAPVVGTAHQDPDAASMLGVAAYAVADFGVALRLLGDAVEGYRPQGRLGLLAQARNMQAWVGIELGDLGTAAPAGQEALSLSQETAQPTWQAFSDFAQAAIAAVRGRHEEAEAHLGDGSRIDAMVGMSDLSSRGQLAKGIAALSREQHEAALAHLLRMFDPEDPSFHRRQVYAGLSFLADAAVACGAQATARAAIDRLDLAPASKLAPGLSVGLSYARAVLAEDDAAGDAAFESALREAKEFGPFVHARLALAHGRRLRRRRQIAEARVQLRVARDLLETLGATPWLDQATRELRAAGDSTRRSADQDWHQLSAQEMQIVALAAEGLTNREIGERLYLSHRTVASHLYRIFPKLGVTTRAQLGRYAGERGRD